jgi:hypothetical protein
MNQSILYPEDIIKSYEKYGEDFITIDLTTIKENTAKTVKYCKLKILKENGLEVVPIIKLVNLTIASKAKIPSEREFDKIKYALRKNDIMNSESKFGEAMELICNTFTKKVKDMKTNGIINDDEDDENNNPNVIIVPNCKSQTPLQKKAKNKEGLSVNLDNPMIWIGLNFKKYPAEDEKKLEVFDGLTYKRDNKPFYIKEFDLNIYDLERLINKKPQLAVDENNNTMNNTNIHKFITTNSSILGTIEMQVIMSKQSFNLNTKFSRNLYVESNKNVISNNQHLFDDSEFESMINKTLVKKPIVLDDEVEYESDNDSEEMSNDLDNKLNNLTFT